MVVDEWDNVPEDADVLLVDLSLAGCLHCAHCLTHVDVVAIVNDVEGSAEEFDLVSKTYALPCGCRQANAEVEPEALEMLLAEAQNQIIRFNEAD